MKIFESLDAPDLQRRDRVLAIGAFDGVHRGHQRLIRHVCRIAADYGAESAVMTFEPIPAQVFRARGPSSVRLTLPDERAREFESHCADTLVVVAFDEAFRDLSAAEFAGEILVERLGVTVLVASKTHTFGRNAEADVLGIAELGMALGFEVHVLPPILVEGERISSTEIRRRLWEGDIQGANQWLGRCFDLAGQVTSGRGVGSQIGFPTANIVPACGKLIPGDGVYACAARIEADGEPGGQWLPAAVSIGRTPTVGDDGRVIEAHIISSDQFRLAGKRLRLRFIERLRDQQAFGSIAHLATQIEQDVAVACDEFQAATQRAVD